MKSKLAVFGGAWCAVAVSAAAGQTLYVDDDAAAGGDGLSWATAIRFLPDALAVAAASGVISEIHVAEGVYVPDRNEANPDGSGECFEAHGGPGCPDTGCEVTVCVELPICCVIEWDQLCVDIAQELCTEARGATFSLVNGVALRGGYAGPGAENPDARDVGLYETVLTGDLLGNDGADFAGNEENAFNVMTGSGTDASAALDGFTVTAGNANGPVTGALNWMRGAGMWNEAGSPTVTDCWFLANRAESHGGGMYNRNGSSPVVTNCVFEGNVAFDGNAGGMFNYDGSHATVVGCQFLNNTSGEEGGAVQNTLSDPLFSNCAFSGNSTIAAGGAMMNRVSGVTIEDCTFTGNSVDQAAGAIGFGWGSGWSVTDCVFTANSAVDGGAIVAQEAIGTITDCVFDSNTASWGGAITNVVSASPTITGCSFSGNSAEIGTDGNGGVGGAIDNYDNCSPTIRDCDFTDNLSERVGGAMRNGANSSPQITNCLFTDNSSGQWGGALRDGHNCSSTVTNCAFQGNTAAVGGGAVGVGSDTAGSTGHTKLTNCVLWGNSAPLGSQIALIGDQPGELTVSYSDVQGGEAGVYVQGGFTLHWSGGNIDADPLFVEDGDVSNCCIAGPGSGCGDCNTPHPPDTGCSHRGCESIVCAIDSYCCDTEWDQICADEAEMQCDCGGVGGGGCDDAGCEALVCTADPYCCDEEWDILCADLAASLCADSCAPVADFHLLPGSPCIDAGRNGVVPAGIETDLDGNPRFVDDPCKTDSGSGDPPLVDMGALERQSPSCDMDGDGMVGITDFLALLAAWGQCDDCDNCPADFDGDCVVGITDFLILLSVWG